MYICLILKAKNLEKLHIVSLNIISRAFYIICKRIFLQIIVPPFSSGGCLKRTLLHLTIITCKMGIITEHIPREIFERMKIF